MSEVPLQGQFGTQRPYAHPHPGDPWVVLDAAISLGCLICTKLARQRPARSVLIQTSFHSLGVAPTLCSFISQNGKGISNSHGARPVY